MSRQPRSARRAKDSYSAARPAAGPVSRLAFARNAGCGSAPARALAAATCWRTGEESDAGSPPAIAGQAAREAATSRSTPGWAVISPSTTSANCVRSSASSALLGLRCVDLPHPPPASARPISSATAASRVTVAPRAVSQRPGAVRLRGGTCWSAMCRAGRRRTRAARSVGSSAAGPACHRRVPRARSAHAVRRRACPGCPGSIH